MDRALASVAALTEDELPPAQAVQPGSIPERRAPVGSHRQASAARLESFDAVASVATAWGWHPGGAGSAGATLPRVGPWIFASIR